MKLKLVAMIGVAAAALVAPAPGLLGASGLLEAKDAQAAASQTSATFAICTVCLDNAGDLSRYGYVTLNSWQHDQIAKIRAASPGTKILVYKDMASTRSSACKGGLDAPLLPAGVGYCWAEQHAPDWFTRDGAGNRIEWKYFPGHWQMDVGTQAYQDAWATNVLAELEAYGWDGVTIDNANVDPSAYFDGRSSLEYPSQEDYAAATRSFLARVGPRLMSAGRLVLPNIQANPVLADDKLWADWIQFTSGGIREYWMKWGTDANGRFGGGGWEDLQGVFSEVQQAGKIFLTSVYGSISDVQTMRWARASFLVGWNGGPAAIAFDPANGVEMWHPEWTVEIGSPTGRRYPVGGAWRRDFTGGTAIANPSSTAQIVSVGPGYVLPNGTDVSLVTLAPLTGIVLRGPGGSVQASPPAPAPAATPKKGKRARASESSTPAARVAQKQARRVAAVALPVAFRRWAAWYTGTAAYVDHRRDARVRPPAPVRIPSTWWRALERVTAAARR